MSKFDQIYRRILLTKFFTRGWGKPEDLKRIFEFRKIISNRETCMQLVEKDYPIHIDKKEVHNGVLQLEGHFTSPFIHHVPGIMPKEAKIARFQVILPSKWKSKDVRPVCLHLAGTGDHFYWRRRVLLAKPLLKEAGIGSIILENPYYGVRKPKDQLRSSLLNVSDLFVMGGALVLESMALFHWCEREGFGPLGITGLSMGGHMASLAATNWPKPISLIPCFSWSTASCVFTQGVLSGAIPWSVLQSQYHADSIYGEEIAKLINSPEEAWKSAYAKGQDFVKHYSENHSNVKEEKNNEGKYILYNESTVRNSNESLPKRDEKSVEFQQQTSQVYSQSDMEDRLLNMKTVHNHQNLDSLSSESMNTNHSGSHSSPKVHFLTLNPNNSTINGFTRLKNTVIENSKNVINRQKQSPKSLSQEALDFMCGVMDECTHLGNFTMPVDNNLIIIMKAKQDAYVPTDSVISLEQLWPGSEVRYINRGHIASCLFEQEAIRKAIIDSFQRQIDKYY